MNIAKRIVLIILSVVITFFICIAVGITSFDGVGWIIAIVIFVVSYLTGKSNE